MTLYGNLLNRFIRDKSVGDVPRRNSMSRAELEEQSVKAGHEERQGGRKVPDTRGDVEELRFPGGS